MAYTFVTKDIAVTTEDSSSRDIYFQRRRTPHILWRSGCGNSRDTKIDTFFSLNDARINMLPSNLRLCLPHGHLPSDFLPKIFTQNLCLHGIIQNRKKLRFSVLQKEFELVIPYWIYAVRPSYRAYIFMRFGLRKSLSWSFYMYTVVMEYKPVVTRASWNVQNCITVTTFLKETELRIPTSPFQLNYVDLMFDAICCLYMRYRETATNKIFTNNTCISFEETSRFSRSPTTTPDRITFAAFSTLLVS